MYFMWCHIVPPPKRGDRARAVLMCLSYFNVLAMQLRSVLDFAAVAEETAPGETAALYDSTFLRICVVSSRGLSQSYVTFRHCL